MKNLSSTQLFFSVFLLCFILLFPFHVNAQAPTTPSSNLSFSSIDGNRMRLNFTQGDGAEKIIIAKADSPVTAVPVDGTDYLADDFGEGNEIAPGEFVVYKGSYNKPTIVGLDHSTTYHFRIYEYNGSNFSTEYLTSNYLEGSQATLTYPTTQASNISFSNVVGSKMTVNWTNGDGSARLLIARANSPVDVEPQDLVNYNIPYYNNFGISNSEIGSGNYAVYAGSGNSTEIIDLEPNTTYHFALFEYNGNNGKVYLTSTSATNPTPPATGNQATSAFPTLNANNMTFSSIDGDRLRYRVNSSSVGNGEKRLVIAKAGSPVTAVPVDGNEYTGDNYFGSGEEIAPGEFVLYSGSSTGTQYLYDLQPHTTYYFKVYEYNGSGTNTFYLKTSDTNGTPVLEANQATITYPTTQASNITFSDIMVTSMNVNWINGDGAGRILIARADSPVDVEPQDLVNYNYPYYNDFGVSGYEIGSGNYIIYQGTANGTDINSLEPNTTYHFALFEYNGNSGKVYLTSTSTINPTPGATASQITDGYTAPTINASNLTFSSIDGNRLRYRVNSSSVGNGESRLIIAKAGSPVTAVPTDGVEYTGDNYFGSGEEIAPGEFVLYSGSSTGTQYLYDLQPHTTYYFKVYEFNSSGTETLYLTTIDTNGDPVFETNQATITYPTTQANNITFSDIMVTNMNVNWTNGDGAGRILIARADSPVDVEPQDLVDYGSPYYNDYGVPSYEIGSGNYIIYRGNANGTDINNLESNTTYHFALFEYNGNSGKVYLTSTSIFSPIPGATASQSTDGYTAPTVNANNMVFSSIDGNRLRYRVNSSSVGNGESRLIIAKAGSPVTAVPLDGNEYTGDNYFGNGDEIAPDEFVLYSGSSTGTQYLYDLQPHTTYYFKVFEFNSSGTETIYLTTTDTNGDPVFETNQATVTFPTVQTGNVFVNSKTTISFNINWTNGNGTRRILVARENEPVNVEPQDLTNYPSSSGGFGNGNYEIGTGNYVLYDGSGTSDNVTNLQPGTNYHFALFEYNGSSGKVYLRPGYTFEAETFGATPTTQVSNVNFAEIGATSMQVNFTRGNGSSRLVIAKKGAPVDVQPSDNTTYLADTNFGAGQEIGANNFVVYNGTDEEFILSNLEETSNYHFAFFEYAINQNNELYLIPGETASQATPAPPTVIPSNFSYTRPCDSDLILNWTSGNGQGRIVILSESPLNTIPTNATNYDANFGYGLGDAIGNGFVVYNGAGNLVPPNLLQASTNYYVNIYEYNGTKTNPIFNMTPLQGFIGDITAPSANCNDIQVVLDENGSAAITPENVGTIPTGDCGTVTAAIDIDTFDCSDLGSNNVTFTITDSDGNTNSCVSIVTVVDETVPTVNTKDITVQLQPDGTATINEDAVDDGSTDACGPLSFDTDITAFDSSDLGDNTVTLTVTDDSGNENSATALVTVIDIAAPTNDDLCNATLLAIDATSNGDAYSNIAASAQNLESGGTCWGGTLDLQTVWFSFEAPSSGNVIVNTNITGGTLNDTQLAVYESAGDCNDLSSLGNELACSDDTNTGAKAETIVTGLNPGSIYYVQVDGKNTQTGTFGIEVSDADCIAPSDLSLDATTDTTADISWTNNGSETEWIVKYSETPGFDPVTEGSSETVNGSPDFQLNGLSANTNYQLYVKANCGGGDESDFIGPLEFTTDCLGSPNLSFLGTGEFQNGIVSPTQGTPETTYEFAVVYTNEDGIMPPYGFPRVVLDYEANGSFSNTNDRSVILSPADPTDNNTSDGKVYVGSISQLPSGTNWQAYVQVQADACETQIGPFDAPNVLIAPDLEIFANDIVFDNPNPDVSSALQITATIHNNSDLPAENFVAHLENQYDPAAVYPDINVDYLGPQESTNVVWNITTPADPSWNPMEVFIDHTDVIAESNELNNRAMRPFINGDYNLPGAINIEASVSPSLVQLPSGNDKVTISGHAYYTDTAVVLQDSTVAGATVTFVNPITGIQVQTHTNSNGYFYFKTHRGSQPGVYTAPVEVTDFTLTAESPITWELVQGLCLKDLRAKINLFDNHILVGESISGEVVVSNNGCQAVAVETLLEIDQTGGLPLINDVTVPPLEPGESFTYPFTAQFDTEGTYYITAMADAGSVVQESSENNNFANSTIIVNPAIPDITPVGSASLGATYLCNASTTQSFGIKNIGYVATGAFDNTIEVYYNGSLEDTFTRTVQNIEPGQSTSVSIPYEYQQTGNYSFVLKCDVPLPDGVVTEILETNNQKSYAIDIIECQADLYIASSCDLLVNPIDLQVPGNVTYSVDVRNRGNATATAPIELQFTLSNGEIYNLVHNQDILPGETVTFVTDPVPALNSGGVQLTASVDPNELLEDANRTNNSKSETLCWEFSPVERCGYDFWNGTYHENESVQLAVGIKAEHLYQASEVKVRFEVSGPGISGWAFLGDAAVQNVKNCHGCPYSAALPTQFVFNQTGVYTFRMTSDPDNAYTECNEGNNVLIKEVTVANKPDMRILSEYINPTLLNPEPGESIFLDISYENIGYSNINDEMELTILIDDQEHAVVQNVSGLIKNTTNTISIPVSYASEDIGLHVIRAIIDSNQEVNDANRNNNEATRSFIVGEAANLFFDDFYVSNQMPNVGETINIETVIENNGEIDVDADVLFSYISTAGDTLAIATKPVSLASGANQAVSFPWNVQQSPTTIVAEIINTSELEFDYNDNFASTQLNIFTVSLVSTPACEGQYLGTLTAQASNGTAPYSYSWSNGSTDEVLEAQAGSYSVTVIDASGKQAVISGIIDEDTYCSPPSCNLSAVSFEIGSECDPNTGVYSTNLVVAYENEPTQGSITVNGTDYPITGSPQSFDIDFTAGPVNYNISFTDDSSCNLTIPTGVVLDACGEDGYVYLNDVDGWSPANPNTDANFTASDDVTIMEGNASFTSDIELNDLFVNTEATLNVEQVLTVNGNIINNGNFIFKSSENKNGELATLPSTSNIIGKFTAERYMSAKRSYRMISSPVTTNSSIHDNWQEGANFATNDPIPGFGTHITGSMIDQENGFDATLTGNTSLFTLDVDNQVFAAVANTDVNTIAAGEGYMIYVRGSRAVDLSSTFPVADATVLRSTGELFTGDKMQTSDLSNIAGEFNMIANPYQSTVDLNSVIANSQNLNSNYAYFYDPTLGTYGSYVTVDLNTGSNSSGSEANQYLQPGQAVQVATATNGTTSVLFSETDKAPGQHYSTFGAESFTVSDAQITGQLFTTENYNSGNKLHDSFVILFASEYDNDLNNQDAIKPFNFTENIGIVNNGDVYSVERRQIPGDGDQIDLYTNNYNHEDYTLMIEKVNFYESVSAYFVDSYTDEEVQLIEGENLINYHVYPDVTESFSSNRFYLRFVNETLSIGDDFGSYKLDLYPNPTSPGEGFYLASSYMKNYQVEIGIRDLLGRLIYSSQEQFSNGKLHIIPPNLGNGAYFIEVKKGNEIVVKRFIIK
ncbi:CARDB domain-containing protein [Psychroflexus halocasei]|uniref:CARDB protein n=1 Tax=Psychroflexus halocasei TaxID=908615 RepID=A0A1H3VKM3_9FLAO|nr:CARDB domain-containing protein [Psychroflexus halocasei]SDZ75327.1 CARDB protein [Psychroflexus halocasei]